MSSKEVTKRQIFKGLILNYCYRQGVDDEMYTVEFWVDFPSVPFVLHSCW